MPIIGKAAGVGAIFEEEVGRAPSCARSLRAQPAKSW